MSGVYLQLSCRHSDFTRRGCSDSSLRPPRDAPTSLFTSLLLASDHHPFFHSILNKAAVHSKKKAAAFEFTDDLFGETASDSGDLFAPDPSQKTSNVVDSTPARTQNTVSTRRKLDPIKRAARFDKLFEFVSGRIGLKPTAKTPEQVRNSAWGHLFELATTRAQLESVTELFPRWRDSRREFKEQTVKNFISE